MIPNLGMTELLLVFGIVVLVFGAGRLPQIGEGVGKAIRNLKRGLSSDDDIEISSDPKRVPPTASTSGAPDVAETHPAEHKR